MAGHQDTQTDDTRAVLIIVAHTDDETLGAGGALARHAQAGDRVYAMAMTDGVGARGADGAAAASRARAAEKAAAALGFKWIEGGAFPDNAMDSVPLLDVAKAIEKAKAEIRPALVYTHSGADLNIDHRIVCQAVLTAFRPQPGESCAEIRACEIPSATDYGHPQVTGSFAPNLFVSIGDTWAAKLAALRAYEAEMRPAPHTRSFEGLEALARCRGHQAGLPMAEAFQVLRKIER
jgi:LmbE family N-acetylglucosaminyl deacetylase